MLRPSVRRQSRNLKQNVKKSVQLSKDKLVATSRHGTSQNRKQVLKNSTHDRNLSGVRNSKLKISVHSSRIQKIPNKLIALGGYKKTSKCHSQSESILKSSIPRPIRKSKSMRLSEGEVSLNLGNDARRITRSSLESVHNTSSENKILKARKNSNISVKSIEKSAICVIDSDLTNVANSRSSKRLITSSQSAEKPVTVKETRIKKQSVVVTKEPKRVTWSSMGSLTDSSLRNISPKSKLITVPIHTSKKKLIKSKQICNKNKPLITKDSKNVTRSMSETGSTSSLLQSAEKQVKSKPTEGKKDSGIVTEVSKRVTHSSLGSATSSTSIRNKNSGHKPPTSPPIQSSRKQIVNEKGQVGAENSKRMTRSSFSSVTNTSIALRNKSPIDTLVAPPLQPQRLAEKRVKTKRTAKEKIPSTVARNSKRLMPSSLGDVSGTSSVTEKTFRSKLVVSRLPPRSSAPKTDKTKKTPKEAGTVQRVSKQKTRSGTSDIEAILEPANDKIKKGKSKKSKESDISTNKKMLSETIKSTPVTPVSSTRNKSHSLQSGSSSGSHYKNKQILSYSKDSDFFDLSNSPKSYFEKELENVPIDCLANVPLSRTVAKKSCKSINSSLIILKNTRENKLNAKEKEGRNSGQSKISKGVKRKTTVSPRIEGKRKRESSPTVLASFEDPTLSIDCLTDKVSNKHPRRHTVDVLLKSKGRKTASKTLRKSSKTSSTKRTKATPKPANVSRANSSSRSTPDTSLLPVDCISTFINKRPYSAPAAIKRPYLVKGLNSTIPKKGTLKRKRWMLNALKEKNECYEDDIFENQKFATPFRIPIEPDDESDTSIATPKFGFLLTPALPKKTPKYRDIISPSELLFVRKTAEEYLFRRRTKRTSNDSTLKTPSSAKSSASASFEKVPEKKKLEFAEAMDKIQAVQNDIEQRAQEESGDEDAYFSDVST